MTEQYRQFEVCRADYPFEEKEGSKNRPIVVLLDEETAVLCVKATTHEPRAYLYIGRNIWGVHRTVTRNKGGPRLSFLIIVCYRQRNPARAVSIFRLSIA